MPNYNITIDSRFDPYSFEDYLKPLSILQEQHNQAADAYATALANSAGLYDALRANAEDAEAAKYVNDYENSLNALANDLATNGLNRTNRRGVYETKAKTGYIEKLKKAIDNRNTFIAQQNELMAKDPTRRLSDYAYNHGITRFLNPDFNYGSYSLNDIKTQVADTVKYLAKSGYVPDGNNPRSKTIGYLTHLMQTRTGASMQEISDAINAVQNGQAPNEKQKRIVSELQGVVEEAVNTNMGNQYKWTNEQRQEALDWGSRGLYAALGDIDYKIWNEQEPKLSSKGDSDKIEINRPWIYKDILTPGGVELRGIDKKQIKMANEVNNAIKNGGDKPNYKIGQTQYMNNVVDYLNNSKVDASGNVSENDKKIALAAFRKSFDDLHGVIPYDLIPEEYRSEYKKRTIGLLADAGIAAYLGTAIGTASGSYGLLPTIQEFLYAKADIKGIQKENEKLFKKLGIDKISDSDINNFMDEYVNYVNTGAVLTEGAFFHALGDSDSEVVFNNIKGLTSNAVNKAAKFKGQNVNGDYVNPLDASLMEDYSESLYDDKGKWKSGNQLGVTMDGNGNVVAVANSGDGAYQFDITKDLARNYPGAYETTQNYREAKSMLKETERKIAKSKAFEKWKQEQEEKALLKELANFSPELAEKFSDFQTTLTQEEQNEVDKLINEFNDRSELTQTAGENAYNALYGVLASKQDLVKITSDPIKAKNG